MSDWTHIVSTIDVDTHKEDKSVKEVVENLLENAPKITGSERDADIFVNVLSGYNIWHNMDCDNCSFKDTVVQQEDGVFTCDAEEDFKCPEGEYQTRVVITIIGDLRDRMKETTKEEYKEFFNYLKKDCNFDIRNKTLKIIGN